MKESLAGQPINVNFQFIGNVLAGIVAYALITTNKIISNSIVGQRHFDLT